MTVKELNSYLDSGNYPARFKEIMSFIFKWECVVNKKGIIFVENDPDDPGGATFCGLDRRSHPSLDFKAITPKEVCDEYLKKYWDKYDCDHYPYPFGEAFFNCCVNCGVGRANKILAAGVHTAEGFLKEQDAFYERLPTANPKMKMFLKGWKNRTKALHEHLKLKIDNGAKG